MNTTTAEEVIRHCKSMFAKHGYSRNSSEIMGHSLILLCFVSSPVTTNLITQLAARTALGAMEKQNEL